MKKSLLAMAASLAVFGAAAQPTSTPPTLNITTNPSGIVYTSSFPVKVDIITGIAMTAGTLKSLNNFDVLVNTLSIIPGGQPLNAYGNGDTCTTMPTGVTCSASDATHGSITVPFSAQGPGQYAVTVRAQYRDDVGYDYESVNVQLIAVEWPAPPSVANGIINSDPSLKTLTSKRRGCVISMIANNHAQLSKYGPKGGPYDQTAIAGDVIAYAYNCSN